MTQDERKRQAEELAVEALHDLDWYSDGYLPPDDVWAHDVACVVAAILKFSDAKRIAYLEDALRASIANQYISESEIAGDYLCLSCENRADEWSEVKHGVHCDYLEDLADLLNGDKF